MFREKEKFCTQSLPKDRTNFYLSIKVFTYNAGGREEAGRRKEE